MESNKVLFKAKMLVIDEIEETEENLAHLQSISKIRKINKLIDQINNLIGGEDVEKLPEGAEYSAAEVKKSILNKFTEN